MQRQEVQHNTPEQVEQYIRDALDLVDTIEPPDDLRAAVFTKACDLLSAKQVVLLQPQPIGLPDLGIPRGRGR